MRMHKPHIYRVGEFWYCKVVWREYTSLGIRSASPKEAYINYHKAWGLTP